MGSSTGLYRLGGAINRSVHSGVLPMISIIASGLFGGLLGYVSLAPLLGGEVYRTRARRHTFSRSVRYAYLVVRRATRHN